MQILTPRRTKVAMISAAGSVHLWAQPNLRALGHWFSLGGDLPPLPQRTFADSFGHDWEWGAAKCPTMHRTAPTTKNDPAQKVNAVQVEKPWV